MVVCFFIAVYCILMICVMVGFLMKGSLYDCIAFNALMWLVVCTWSCFADIIIMIYIYVNHVFFLMNWTVEG